MQKEDSIKIKGIAIILLLFHHLFYSAARVESSGMQFLFVTQERIEPIAVAARICVQLFIFLSAYGLTYQYMNKREKNDQWLLKRWISLMNPFWFIYIITFLGIAIIERNPFELYENSLMKMIFDIIGWSDFFGTSILLAPWWYMCFAQILLFCIPVLYCFCGKFGWGSFVITFLFLQYIPDGIVSPYGGKYSNYFLVIVFAVICVRKKVFESFLEKKNSVLKNRMFFWGGLGTVFLLLYAKYRFTDIDQWQVNSVISSLAAFLICIIGSKYLKLKLIKRILEFLGKHSGNIFMIHAFFYTYTEKLLYWSKNAIISFLSLILISLAVSLLIEKIKKIIHYNEFFACFTQKIVKFLE